MYFFYNILIAIVGFFLKIIALLNKKINLFIEGRKATFLKLETSLTNNSEVIWFHCASLGEFEQGRPIIEAIKKENPNCTLLLTFFSPSGYEIRKNYESADIVCYLPLDSKRNAKKFIEMVNPALAVFVKYEFWPNILRALKNNQVETLLISGIFRKKQPFFKWYGGWMRKSLTAFKHFFVQDENSKELLNSIGYSNVTVSGDTRFDRVFEITKQNNKLPFIEDFIDGNYTLVAGSTWKEDEELLINYINTKASKLEKFIIVPHNIDKKAIEKLKNELTKKTILFSEKDKVSLKEYQVLIVDTVGILTKIYSYASIAYVGGGFTKTGVHNVLEPAVFGVPIIIGPQFSKFNEVKDLVKLEACFSINNFKKLSVLLEKFFHSNTLIEKAGTKAYDYVMEKTGATTKILNYLKK